MPADQPRQHHYIPQFYLQGFAQDGAKEGRFWVFDKSDGRQWPSSPKEAAAERDFYRVDRDDGGDPFALEKCLQKVEDLLAPVLFETIERRSLPLDRDFDVLLNLVALTALRVPALRTFSNHMAAEASRKKLLEALASRDSWEKLTNRMRAAGIDSPGDPGYEDMKRFVESDDCEITIDMGRNWFADLMITGSCGLLSHLSRRRWYLSTVASGSPDLICSDNPVSLSPTSKSPPGSPTGFAAPGTLLLFPLNRRVVLVGSFEGMMLPPSAPDKTVALVNAATARNAERFIFSSAPEFVYRDQANGIRSSRQLREHIQEQSMKHRE